MITNHRKIVWAEELGIDMKQLRKEHPDRWEQIMMKKRLGKRAEDYWARERMLARVEPEAPEAVYTPPSRVKTRGKKAKVKSYEFTDAQLEIAKRSLNARGSV